MKQIELEYSQIDKRENTYKIKSLKGKMYISIYMASGTMGIRLERLYISYRGIIGSRFVFRHLK